MIVLNSDFSTTRCVTRTLPNFNLASDTKLISTLTLDLNDKRRGAGGLREQGYFKAGILNTSHETQHLPLVTIITAVFNGAKTLEQTILSVISQSYKNVEFIVIDGGSTDETMEVLKKYEHAIDYWISEPDTGIYNAWNKGVRLSQGEWICFLGADDYLWNDRSISDMVGALNEAPISIRLAYAKVMLLSEKAQDIHEAGEPWLKINKRFKQVMCIPHQGVMHRRSLFEENGLFDESFRIAGDYEFLLRELKIQDAMFVEAVTLAGMRQGGVSSTPVNSLKTLYEIRRAQRLHGAGAPGKIWFSALIRSYIKAGLWSVLGERRVRKVLDFYRRMVGLPPYWTKL